MSKKITETCYEKSIELLVKNSIKFGFSAASQSTNAKKQQYLSIFGRDASICALGAVASKDKRLTKTAKASLVNLGKFQAFNGQIPNYIKPNEKAANFWYIGCIDATLWWLIAIKFYDKYSQDKIKLQKRLRIKIYKAINWLYCQEHPGLFLLQQNEASAWADNMPREGYVLYTNTLWYGVKELYKLKNTEETKKFFEYLHGDKRADYKKYLSKNRHIPNFVKYMKGVNNKNYYLSYVNRSFWGDDVDVYGNMLAIISSLSSKAKSKKITDFLIKNKANKPYPVKTLLNPIKPKSKNWRVYMEEYATNYPNLYHNGGIWPFIGGFWIIALAKAGKKKIALEELTKLAMLNKKNDWQFNEWFHGKTGKPMGMPGQSWNAGMFLLAWHYLKDKIDL